MNVRTCVRECTYTLDSIFLFCPTTLSFEEDVTSVPVLTITGVTAKDTEVTEFTFKTGPVRDDAIGIKLFVFTFFFICITAPVDVVELP